MLPRSAGVPLVVPQPRYSLFDRGPELNGLIDLAAQDGFGIVVHSPLAQGLLTDKYLSGSIPEGARARASALELILIDKHGVHGTALRPSPRRARRTHTRTSAVFGNPRVPLFPFLKLPAEPFRFLQLTEVNIGLDL
ncbi:aldo/keto reductase [Streptomyces sp. NPDC048565]|uniref:aldo/keto reductase n=1 Tax=Streptomyces sp. NPDC048565 TaxID=3155266 RepID=UPI00342C2901